MVSTTLCKMGWVAVGPRGTYLPEHPFPASRSVVDISYPSLFNLTGHPVVVIPIGFTESGLPVGIQIVGKRWRDAELLVVANQLFKVGGDFRNPPDFKN